MRHHEEAEDGRDRGDRLLHPAQVHRAQRTAKADEGEGRLVGAGAWAGGSSRWRRAPDEIETVMVST